MTYFAASLAFLAGFALGVYAGVRFSRHVVFKMVKFGRLRPGPNFKQPRMPGE
jgi:hypothetical protein